MPYLIKVGKLLMVMGYCSWVETGLVVADSVLEKASFKYRGTFLGVNSTLHYSINRWGLLSYISFLKQILGLRSTYIVKRRHEQ